MWTIDEYTSSKIPKKTVTVTPIVWTGVIAVTVLRWKAVRFWINLQVPINGMYWKNGFGKWEKENSPEALKILVRVIVKNGGTVYGDVE